MDGTDEVNESLESSADVTHIKRKDSDNSQQSNNCNMIESTSLFISDENEWHEHLSSLRSPELVMGALKGKDLVRQTSSQSGSESLGTSPRSMNNTDAMVEELTMKAFKFPNLSLAGSSSSGDEVHIRQGLWQNFYKLAGESRDVASKESTSLANGMDIGSSSFNRSWAPRALPQNHLERNDANISEHLMENENNSGLCNVSTRFSRGILTKVLPSSGFPQFLVKSTLKGKGVAYRHPGPFGLPGVTLQGHNNQSNVDNSPKGMNDALQSSIARADDMPALYGGGGSAASTYDNGTSLRVWLKSHNKINKSVRLHMFKQILELVDTSHSKGIALQHLWPSYLMVFPSDQVKYVGSFVSPAQLELLDNSIGQNTENLLKRKRCLDEGGESIEFLSTRHRRAKELMKGGGINYPMGIRGGMRGESVRELSFKSDFREQPSFGEDHHWQNASGGLKFACSVPERPNSELMLLEERWYASPEELSGAACPYASNIYSLGVIFFELFCCFESWEVHAAAMLDLRHRILPSSFLSESPKEAGFCLWLLHPEPSSRPKSREVMLSSLIRESENLPFIDQSLASFDEEDAEVELLSHFLLSVKEQKEKDAEKLVKDIGCLQSDLEEVNKRHSSKIESLSVGKDTLLSYDDRILCQKPLHLAAVPRSATPSINESRLMTNINQLEKAYLSMRSKIDMPETISTERSDKDVLQSRDGSYPVQNVDAERHSENEPDRLGAFFDGLCKYARYSKFEVRGTMRNGDILNSANVICSLSFDRDEEYFAAAGVSKKIRIFDYGSLLNDAVDIHYPAIEMSSKSRLSCVCWNGYIKNYLASTDYGGIVQLWDAGTGQGFAQYTEHQKRAWSVDFSRVDPTKLASGSDDCSVKLWSLNEKNSTSTIRNVANVCCVQFSADSTNLLAFGSADYKIYCYDLRNVRIPWCTLVGHGKAVSYVRFVDSQTLVSASTDNTLKLWDLNKTSSGGFSTSACSLTLGGHTNEKNFVGLSVSDGYIACGSETNEVFAYYKSLPMPINSHKFGSIDPISGQEIADDNGQFVSSVCWRGKSNMVVAANSTGSIKLLQMV